MANTHGALWAQKTSFSLGIYPECKEGGITSLRAYEKKTVDRFIHARINSEIANFNLTHSDIQCLTDTELEDEKDGFLLPKFLNTAKTAINIVSYRKSLLNAMGVKRPSVLNYPSELKLNKLYQTNPWPVHPRKKPLLKAPETVLDMPEIDTVDINAHRQVVDWGKNGQIATIFHGEVHIWPATDHEIPYTKTGNTISDCVKWNRFGSQFAVSRTESRISIFSGKKMKILETRKCQCISCTITAIEWSNNNYVITGCSQGSVIVLSPKKTVKRFYKLLKGAIVDLKLSCNNTYLLISTLRGDSFVFKWPLTWKTSCAMLFKVFNEYPYCIKSTAWHPWKEPILVLAAMDNTISVWNVNNHKLVERKQVGPFLKKSFDCILDFITFNPLSGELLVSFYYENPDPDSENGCNLLTVFSNLDTRVDEIRYHIGRVPYILWDGTGKKLASIGTDENLAIWNFFGTQSDEETIYNCESKKKKQSNSLFLFRECIR